MVDASAPEQNLTVVACMGGSAEDRRSAHLSIYTDLDRLDADAPATVLVSAFDRIGEEASASSEVNLGSEPRQDGEPEDVAWLSSSDLDWVQTNGQWCSEVGVQFRHISGGAVEAQWQATLVVEYFGDEPDGLSVRIEGEDGE